MQILSLKNFLLLLLFGLVSACSHSYYYLPEIAGPGAMHEKKGDVSFRIPPVADPLLTMKVKAIGFHKTHNVEILGIRMAFIKPKATSQNQTGTQGFLDPTEQVLHLGELKIKPVYVHSKSKQDKLVQFSGAEPQVVDLLFPLPKNSEAAKGASTFSLSWKVHYAQGKTEMQTTRFDRYDSAPQQSGELFPEDSDYPYDMSPAGNFVEDPYWWALSPW